MSRADVSIEVAEHILKRHCEQNPEPITPYRVIACPGKFPATRRPFIDNAQLRTDIQIRNGRMVTCCHAYKLQQWLVAEALIRERWPKHQRLTMPAMLVDPVKITDGIDFFPFLTRGPKRRRRA